MRRAALLLLAVGLWAGVVSAQPDPKTVVPDVMPEVKLPAKEPDPRARGLGRAKPKKQYDYGHFRAVVGSDGVTRYFARLTKYMDAGAVTTPYPASVDWSAKAPNVLKRMYLNNQYGDCVIASRYHQLGFQSAADTGTGLEGTDAEVYAAYQSACGRGDNGCDMSAVNQYQKNTGLKVNGVIHKTDGSVSVDHTNKELVKAAIVVFGGINVGFSLPNAWYQSADGSVWDTTNTAIVGGHEVQAYGYDDKYVYISTWGGYRKWTWAAFLSTRWIDETYTTLSADWYGSDKLAPNGINADALKADLALISGGTIPPLPDPNPPPVVPPVVPPVTPPIVPPVVPPVPGAGFTGNITTVKSYANGVYTGEKVIVGPASASIEDELKSAGVSPLVILDVLKLLADVKAKAGKDTIIADMLKIISDIGLAEPRPELPPLAVPSYVPPVIPKATTVPEPPAPDPKPFTPVYHLPPSVEFYPPKAANGWERAVRDYRARTNP